MFKCRQMPAEYAMKRPDKDVPSQRFELRNSAGKDVAFEGWCLAKVDNYNPDARDERGLAMGSKRWKERAVYVTKSGNVVCHKLGCSQVPGETDRGEVLVIRKPDRSELPRYNSARATEPLGFNELLAAPGDNWADQQVCEFFRGDSLAKDLLEEVGIADVEEID